MNPVYFVNIKDHENTGDVASTPYHYFGNAEDIWADIRTPIEEVIPPDGRQHTVVIGGGGLLHPGLGDCVLAYCQHPRCRTIIWGIGSNYHYPLIPLPEKNWVNGAVAVGLRDVATRFAYVPCVSCMYPAFTDLRKLAPVHKVVVYEHYDHPIPLTGVPHLSNGAPSLLAVLVFLSRGEIILTNSFHGAYWGRLLGRKVLVYEPFSTRFYAPFEKPLSVVSWSDLPHIVERGEDVHPCFDQDYLLASRRATVLFHQSLVLRKLLREKS